MNDKINHPPHYTYGSVETIDYITQVVGYDGFVGYCIGNILKYISRAEHKNGLEDYKKARWYLDRLIAEKEKHLAEKEGKEWDTKK